MADAANLTVHEPGDLVEEPSVGAVQRLSIDLAVAFADYRRVEVHVSDAGVGEVADALHRIGGEALLRELQHALGAAVRRATFAEATLASSALRILERHSVALRRESMAYLEALDASVRQLFEFDLTLAALELRPERFGLQLDEEGKASVSSHEPDLERYRRLRSVVAELDALRRNVREWRFTIPPNARTARRQFEEYALEPYLRGLKTAAEMYPALAVLAPKLLKALANESPADVEAWEADPGNATRLDQVIQEQVLDATRDLQESQPGYRDQVLAGAQRAMAAANRAVERYWAESPAEVLGQLHPLWRHRFLVQAALEQQGYKPGDHGYAVGIDSLYAAMANEARERQDAAEIDRVLGWASLGFGVLLLVPIVGEFALLGAIAITAIQTLEEAQRYAAATTVHDALGPQAFRYDVPEPDAIGLLCNVLSLTADVALPMVGALLSKSVLRPTTRVIAASRVKTALGMGQHAANLAGLVASANAASVEHELRRLQLFTAETGRQ